MRVAIIEENPERLLKLDDAISEHPWDVNFFRTPQDFGKANLSAYDVVVADCILSTINGRDLLNSLSGKTRAQMLLIGDSTSVFSSEDIENENINGFAHNPVDLVEQLEYLDSKIRINKMMEQESDRINGLLSNGFKISLQGTTGILDISNIPVRSTLARIEAEIKELKITGIVVCFQQETLYSAHLGILVALYKIFKNMGIKMAFWNRHDSLYVQKLMTGCNLDNLFGIYAKQEDAEKAVSA